MDRLFFSKRSVSVWPAKFSCSLDWKFNSEVESCHCPGQLRHDSVSVLRWGRNPSDLVWGGAQLLDVMMCPLGSGPANPIGSSTLKVVAPKIET